MAAIKKFGIFILFAFLILIAGTVYIVNEGEQALILRLGEIKKDSKGNVLVYEPGLHFKLPLINTVSIFDVRLRTLDVQSSRILTDQQKYVLVDYYTKWRIKNLPYYYTRTGGVAARAESLLSQKINNSLRAAFGNISMSEVISGQRLNIMALLKKEAEKGGEELGIEVIDVRIKRIDLPSEVSESVFARMRTKREQVATKHRSDGEAEANNIRAAADANVTVAVANARKESAEIRAKGISDAAKIYTDAYNQDPEFYAFYRSLEAYRQSFNNKDDLIVLQPNSDFFKYYNKMKSSFIEKSVR